MTDVLLSIRPLYVRRIFDGTKRYEFRRRIFARTGIERIYIYCSSPVSKLVGSFRVEEILEGSPRTIWRQCQEFAGIDAFTFFEYFRGKPRGFAIGIGKLRVFGSPVDLARLRGLRTPPQSFCYLDCGVEDIDSSAGFRKG